ncbi:EAL domain-containing protein [Brumicola nitratireducens]|uniref:PAS sensor protein n=1 Tax=Glaciecola nitratireducens (strain JCM 12485 / KCTC 12276 / FR1064) TaxID=1085623 RepID=G4QJL1_GLANF|nr:EAL domain-containing protein [Glaciecola nitratireducens]AEP28671.1 PAS sensor protein [Glaciecola nitratireducens FR1064]
MKKRSERDTPNAIQTDQKKRSGPEEKASVLLTKNSVPVVGIGASAGGLETFIMFFDAMPAKSGMAFVLIQHLDPNHKSLTAEIIAKHTLMPVHQVDDQMHVEANKVYVIPPNKDLTISQNILLLSEPSQAHGQRMPIDIFLRSLAKDKQENAICIILSGTGTDGSLGIKSIKDKGGLVLVQAPETSKFDGMPQSAIDTGFVDCTLPVQKMPSELLLYFQSLQQLIISDIPVDLVHEQLDKILSALRLQTKYDFSNYKKGTLTRRIERRMGLKHLTDFAEYAHIVQQSHEEAQLLLKDLLISVTDFFREPEAYKQLENDVVQKIINTKAPDDVIRVWTPGCATGEEPYSIAMVILEQLQLAKKHNEVQIFASDIDEQAISVARAGRYPVNITSDISTERLQQFFIKKDNHYQVNKTLRDCVVFATQNLISDPPFSKVDLISCRNLLIYLEPAIQKKIISMFHFALNEGGYLFLGSAETIGQHEDLFQPLSKKLRLYRRVGKTKSETISFPTLSDFSKQPQMSYPINQGTQEAAQYGKITQQLLLQHYAPFAVLINKNFDILYVNGQSGRYLEMTTGKPSQDLISVLREGIRSKLRAAVQLAMTNGEMIEVTTRVKRDANYYPIQLSVHPIHTLKSGEDLLLISFSEVVESNQINVIASATPDELQHTNLLHQLEEELAEAKDDLRTCLEDMASSTEELKVSHEEVLSMNEELQSSNEELETSKEELQSLNEELTTVNNQLQNKVEELAIANDDMTNLLESADIAALFLDVKFCIKRFTPAMRALFQLIKSDVGRPISDISHQFVTLDLVKEAELTLKNRLMNEIEVKTTDDKCYIVRISPFRTNDGEIEGVVVTFFDITRLNQIKSSLSSSRERIELLLKSTGEAIYGVDVSGKCTFVNAKLVQDLGFTEQELIGRDSHTIFHHTRSDGSDYPWSDCFVYQCLKDQKPHRGANDLVWRKDGTSFPISYSVGPIIEHGELRGAVVIFRDMTKEYASINKLDYQARHDALTGLINRREFDERLERVLQNSPEDQDQHVLCYLDLDQFKVINDACGHLAGDELLRQLSNVLQSHVRKRDTLARLGGDEFGLLMEHCDLHEGKRVANGMRDAVANYRFFWQGNTHMVGVSIGLVEIIGDGQDKTDLLKAADAACYAAKENGRNRVHVYSEQDTNMAARHGQMKWVARINLALENNRFLLVLQPIVPINGVDTNKLSYEVLIRMRDGDNIIQPDDFLGAAERYNLSSKVDLWVIRNTFNWMTDNKHQLENVALININISGQSLGDQEFLKHVVNALKAKPIPTGKICFEITETAAITNFTNANSFMHALKNLGCEFALDDFGTGLSSFEYLKALPVEYIKIAGLFVKDIATDSVNLAMVKAISDLGHEMNKKVIAESVENKEILDCLVELGVDFAQGYFFGKAVPLSEIKLNESDITDERK